MGRYPKVHKENIKKNIYSNTCKKISITDFKTMENSGILIPLPKRMCLLIENDVHL